MNPGKFDNLKSKLLENKTWPLLYMFKVIVPNIEGNVERAKEILPSDGKFNFNHTKNLNYVSITCVAKMNSADEIIEISEKAASINGAMVL